MAKKIRYHFSCGDSNDGPIGLCGAVITDKGPEEAVRIFRESLCSELGVELSSAPDGFEYGRVYVNVWAITVTDIDEEEPEPADGSKDGAEDHER